MPSRPKSNLNPKREMGSLKSVTKKLVCNRCGKNKFNGFNKRWIVCGCGGIFYALNECAICKKTFKPKERKQVTCSKKCHYIHSHQFLRWKKPKKCLNCKKEFIPWGEITGRNGGKTERIQIYCSLKCYAEDPNNYRNIRRKKEINFESAWYKNLHKRIRRKMLKIFGKDYRCWECGIIKHEKWGLTWSNKDHEYKEDLEDWNHLCRHCHVYYDKGEIKLTLKFKPTNVTN